ncbi:uncharacterized protein (DUF427 family) [Actinomycetospora succinea]|uniref:Uncharacterized protein (DUF427 family) n=1 Tax=Actinomycetospora succinea TaxID=663603 RepID=A0A4R6UZU2_9PSEU|nr:DUF427 domain-containing protein [Actinomycetospora succinea]TDQ51669.1 uncharacterized protein (DUF427 family) [Actinomycetospora succinea]
MALTMFGGPLSRKVPETRTFTVEGPAHSLLLEPFTRRVRAEVDGVTVLDTTRGALLFETGLPPQLYVPEEDFRADLLEPSDTTTHCPFKGDATYRSLRVGDRVVPDAVWSYPDPIAESSWLAGLAVLAPEAADRWFDEDDEVIGRLPDPYHRVSLRHTSRHVTVTTTDGVTVADADGGVLLGETGLVDRLYVPRDAISATLEPSGKRTTCPYKGYATYYSVRLPDGRVLSDAAWSYEQPTDESRAIEDLVCFAHDDLTVAAEVR